MWGTSAGVNAVAGKQVGERLGHELPSVIAVDGSHDTCGSVTSFVQEGVEARQKLSDVRGCLVLVFQEMDRLEPGVVVHHDKCVSLPPILRWYERSSNIYVDEPTWVASSVRIGTVW
eukprot:6194550-Pleurochrysis_carterae.AAC.3